MPGVIGAVISDGAISGLIAVLIAIVGHGIHDWVRFERLMRDIKWMKAVMRKNGMVAPNGDDN
jgi:hypothetical protein